MAASMFKPPAELNITDDNVSQNFSKWKRQMEVYLTASGVKEKEKETQVAVILHCAGPSIIEIYDQFEWENDDHKKDPERVIKKIEEYCNPRKSEVIETHRFWSVQYEISSGFEPFLTEIRKRAETCNFKEKNRMMRDKIVFSANGKLQELLLREDDLQLEKAIKICRAFEQSNKHVSELREKTIHKVTHDKKKENDRDNYVTPRREQGNHYQKKTCGFCGYKHEMKKEKCPAWGKTCDGCRGRNHFKKMCKKVHAVNKEEPDVQDDSDDCWLAMITTRQKNRVSAKMNVNDCEINFQLDTAADINTICQKYVKKEQVKATNINLRMWNNSAMKPLGCATLSMTNPQTDESHDVDFVVVPNTYECLLGLKTVQELNLVIFNTDKFISKVTTVNGDLGEVHLKVDKDATPKALPCRNVPLAIKDQVKQDLDNLVQRGILKEVTEPTKWVSQMAVVRKPNGKLRLCIDPQPLNQALMREHYKLPVLEDILPELHDAKMFTKLDVKEAYWHCKLDEESSLLTTMITPYGRYRWLRLPFGLKVSSEIFQRKLNEALSGLDGTFTIADDIIIVGCGNNEDAAKLDNDRKLKALYKRCAERNILLNEEKKAVGKEIHFHGHKITAEGILPDETRISSVLNMASPKDVTEVKRLCGVIQYMAKFLPSLSTTLEPIRNLTRKDVPWQWTDDCEKAFCEVKKKLTEAPVLAYFNPDKELSLQVDSSKDGLGAVLMQDGRPIEFASRSLKPAERKWAQIEKEALAVLYGLERFDQYTYGRKVKIENDHKPLETILKKPLSQAPKRLQDILMKLFRYDIEFHFVKGVELVIADALSRNFDESEQDELTRTRVFGLSTFEHIPDARIIEIREEIDRDDSLKLLIDAIINGWPEDKAQVDPAIRPYFAMRDTLSHNNGVILKGEAVLVPKALRKDMMARLHSAHTGHDSMIRRAKGTLFWIGMNKDIQELAERCEACMERKPQNTREELQQHDDGKYPFEKVGMDLFEIEGRHYLLTIDYFSNYIEVELLSAITSKGVIEKLKKQFARFGIPARIVSDGGPQFSSQEFLTFTSRWGIQHHITSPHHPQSNGKAEAGVKIAKNMMIKCANTKSDPYEALLELRNTPRKDTSESPAEMMFGRKLRTQIPSVCKTEKPCKSRFKRKESVKKYYDKRSKNLLKVKPEQSVYFKRYTHEPWRKGLILKSSERRHCVTDPEGTEYQRNRVHIRPTEINTRMRDLSPVRLPELSGETIISDPVSPRPTVHADEALTETTEITTRPVRIRRPPKYLEEYKCD